MVFAYYERLNPPQELVCRASDRAHAIRVHGGPAGRGRRGLRPGGVPRVGQRAALTVLLALGSACSSGLAFGIHPATRANRLDPVEGKRAE